jgi:integral membrane protein (TIGR01906 family)
MEIPTVLIRSARIAIMVAVPILLVVTPLYIFISPGFVRHEYAQPTFPPSTRFTPLERLRISDTMVEYLRGEVNLAEMADERTDGGQIALKPSEVDHLVDVKQVTDGFFLAHQIAIVVAVVSLALLIVAGATTDLARGLRQGVWLTAGLILFVLLFAMVDFRLFFTRFHQLFFTEGTWIFYETDTLIQLYPLRFWIDAVWKLGVSILIEAAFVLSVAFAVDRRFWQREAP